MLGWVSRLTRRSSSYSETRCCARLLKIYKTYLALAVNRGFVAEWAALVRQGRISAPSRSRVSRTLPGRSFVRNPASAQARRRFELLFVWAAPRQPKTRKQGVPPQLPIVPSACSEKVPEDNLSCDERLFADCKHRLSVMDGHL